jgi:hypothetical protein
MVYSLPFRVAVYIESVYSIVKIFLKVTLFFISSPKSLAVAATTLTSTFLMPVEPRGVISSSWRALRSLICRESGSSPHQSLMAVKRNSHHLLSVPPTNPFISYFLERLRLNISQTEIYPVEFEDYSTGT